MSSIFRKLFRWLMSLAAAAVIILALLVGVVRLLLPLVPEYHDDIRNWASEATGFDVAFQQITATWPLSGPELLFYDVSVTSPVDGALVLDAEEFGIGISVMQLIIERKPTLRRVFFKNAQVKLERSQDGSLLVQGRALDEFRSRLGSLSGSGLPDVLLEFQEIDVVFIDHSRDEQSLGLLIDQLEIDVTSGGILVSGEMELSSSLGSDMEISADIPAELLSGYPWEDGQRPEWEMYLSAGEIDIALLLENWLDVDVFIPSSSGGVIVWAGFSGFQPHSITIELDLDELIVAAGSGAVEEYDALSGRFEWSTEEGGWVAGVTELRIRRDNRTSPKADFRFSTGTDPDDGSRFVEASAGFVRLQDAYPLVRVFARHLSAEARLPADIAGDLRDLEFHFNQKTGSRPVFNIRAEYEYLGLVARNEEFSVSGLTGMIAADQQGGRMSINSRNPGFSVPRLFRAPIRIDSVDGLFVWRASMAGIRLLSDNVVIQGPGMRLQSRLEVNFPDDGSSPYIDLHAVGSSPDVTQVVQYLPLQLFPKAVGNWLDRSILKGQASHAAIELRGPVDGFPYLDGDGVFRISAQFENAELDYAAGWPHVTGAKGTVVFEGMSLSSTRNHGHIGDLEFTDADISIRDYKHAALEVSASQEVPFADVLDFLRASPVAATIGPTIEDLQVSGLLDTRLELNLPFKPEEMKNYQLDVEVNLQQNDVSLRNLDPGLAGLQGTLWLHNTQFSADNLTAVLLDRPIEISVEPTGEGNSRYSQIVHAQGITSLPVLSSVFGLPSSEQLTGDLTWNLAAFLPRYRQGASSPLHILVNSDLEGITSVLPVPLGKEPGQTERLDLEINLYSQGLAGAPEAGTVDVYGQLDRGVSWAVQFERDADAYSMERVAVHLGHEPALMPDQPMVSISGQHAVLRLSDWLSLLENNTNLNKLQKQIDFEIDEFVAFGQVFRDSTLRAEYQNGSWRIDTQGPAAKGVIIFPDAVSGDNPVTFNMERLWLVETDPRFEGMANPQNIFPMTVHIEDFRIGTMSFGVVNLNAVKVPQGIAAESITASGSGFVLEGEGSWLADARSPESQISRLTYRLNSTDVEATLAALGYDPVIKGGKAEATADLSWPGAPDDSFLQRASGSISVKLKQGRLINLEPGGGRLLGLLSISALPRRLSMDFSDVFKEGLSFDTFSGDFRLDDGNAYTCNLDLEGNVAAIGVIGRTGIKARDYEQLVVVRPHVSNVFPLGAAVLGGPGVGAAAFLISQIFRKPLSSLGGSYYEISGDWDQPAVVKIQRNDVDVKPFKECEQYLMELVPELTPVPNEAVDLTRSMGQ